MASGAVTPDGVSVEHPDRLFRYQRTGNDLLNWECLFTLPAWLRSWWTVFGKKLDPHVCFVRHHGALIGIAPLVVDGHSVRLIGDDRVSDYVDFITAPGRETDFLKMLIRHLRASGIGRLDYGPVRSDSPCLSVLLKYSDEIGCVTETAASEPFYELALPDTWEHYLSQLDAKQRHEVLRKLRRCEEAGSVSFNAVEDRAAVEKEMDTFIRLFRLNRRDKALFMDGEMERFFRALAPATAEERLLRLFILRIDDAPAAATMCFDLRSTVYLYNNGYDKRYSSLNVAQVSKILSIRDSIGRGRKAFNFLKGSEPYKKRLGGNASTLCKCYVTL